MPTKDIQDACLELRNYYEEIKSDYFKHRAGKYLDLTCVHRTPEEQLALFKKGRRLESGIWVVQDKSQVVTNVDGLKILGPHNYYPSRAIDFRVVDNQTGKVTWEKEYYYPLLEIAKRLGLESGGEWTSLKDFPHVQVRNFKTYKGG